MSNEQLDKILEGVKEKQLDIAIGIGEFLRNMNPGLNEVRSTDPYCDVMLQLGYIVPEGVEKGSYRLTESGREIRRNLILKI